MTPDVMKYLWFTYLNSLSELFVGFIKLALKCGADLLPSFSFGEQLVYDYPDNPTGKNSIMHSSISY